ILSRKMKSTTGAAGMVGQIGRAETALTPEGKVLVQGELWIARGTQPVPAGTSVRVRSVDDDLKLTVEPVAPPATQSIQAQAIQQAPNQQSTQDMQPKVKPTA